jgi:hypothetical protein
MKFFFLFKIQHIVRFFAIEKKIMFFSFLHLSINIYIYLSHYSRNKNELKTKLEDSLIFFLVFLNYICFLDKIYN